MTLKRGHCICQLHYLFSDILSTSIETSKVCHGELININSNCLKYNKTSINDLNTKMTEYNGYLGPGLGQAKNSVKPINMIISFSLTFRSPATKQN